MKRQQMVIILASMSVVAAALAMSGELQLFLNPAGLLLVVGGTLAGVSLAFPTATLRETWQEIKRLTSYRYLTLPEIERLFVYLARLQRDKGVRALERAVEKRKSHFLQMAVGLVADGAPIMELRPRLDQEFDFYFSRREAQRAVLSLMGRLAPAFGLAGTMIGLIRMLHTVKDPGEVAAGMSVALLTTFYGIMVANLLILPLERKLREKHRAEAMEMALIIEGVMGLAIGDNGAAMSARLGSFRHAAPATAAGGQGIRGLITGLGRLVASKSSGNER